MISIRTLLILSLGLVTVWYLTSSSSELTKDDLLESSLKQQLQQKQQGGADGIVDLKAGETISRRLVAVADLHGDLQHAHNVLRMAGLIDSSNHWSAGHDILVSTGDIVDRGDDTIELYKMFQRLRKEASQVGGQVHNSLGNHEVMNALHDWRYVTKGDISSFGGPIARRKVMSTQGWIGSEWLSNYNITSILELLPSERLPATYPIPKASFVHGGITPEYAQMGIEEINRIGKSFLFKALNATNLNGHNLPPGSNREEAELYSDTGPLWYRGYAYDNDLEACKNSKEATRSLGVDHLVMGHTPHFEGFITRCDFQILLIDTGISRAYGGEQSALIFDSKVEALEKDSKFKQEKILTALYRGRKPRVLKREEKIVQI